jgi:hypothetical protein
MIPRAQDMVRQSAEHPLVKERFTIAYKAAASEPDGLILIVYEENRNSNSKAFSCRIAELMSMKADAFIEYTKTYILKDHNHQTVMEWCDDVANNAVNRDDGHMTVAVIMDAVSGMKLNSMRIKIDEGN